jgi:hypothetical protein
MKSAVWFAVYQRRIATWFGLTGTGVGSLEHAGSVGSQIATVSFS